VRLFGIDPKAKRRVMETIIQRPNGQSPQLASNSSRSAPPSSSSDSPPSTNSYTSAGHAGGTQLSAEAVEQVRQLLSQGYRIGAEHADKRRFQTSSWQSCAPIEAKREAEVTAALEECLSNHSGEYVRLFGIDPKAKRRVMEAIIQRPDR
jgi:carbon dioxide concentrating mechanism protein CcmM